MGKRILGIFAHSDDEVIGAGGLFLLNTQQNGKNHIICVNGSKETRRRELLAAAEILGASAETLGYENFTGQANKPLIGELRDHIKRYQPHILVTHDGKFDYNCDHRFLNEIVLEAAQRASHGSTEANAWKINELLTTETHALHPTPDRVYNISEVFEKKQEAMAKHKSQLTKGTISQDYYTKLNEAKALLRGVQGGCKYGEAFMVKHLPVVADLWQEPLAKKEV
jgi:4-oxalomesaconate hydratase